MTGRGIGDGPSNAVFDVIRHNNKKKKPEQEEELKDHAGYLMKTADGKILKCSTSYIRDDDGSLHYVFGINYDITILLAAQTHIQSFTATAADATEASSPETVSLNVSDLLDELIEQAFQRIRKPAAVMTKDDKIDFIRLLNDAGAFLITKSGQRVCQVLCISKFTLYSYLNEIKAEDEETKAEQD